MDVSGEHTTGLLDIRLETGAAQSPSRLLEFFLESLKKELRSLAETQKESKY